MKPAHFQTYRNRIHKAPLVVKTSGASGDFIRVMSVSEAYQDDHVPKGSEAEPLAELAYGLQVP